MVNSFYDLKASPRNTSLSTAEGASEADTTVESASLEDDKHQVEELSQMSAEEVLEKVEQLKSMAFALGESEAHEMTRGKSLDVFGLKNKK
ncbi:uncharacterized protein LOC114828569 [Galendromus occidentalis]|uniref:Uncharacterized protein LOC114828569 n=1 Tax=Galendromus occidentalis TaxID=34638 RepID=A0AAJ7SJE0_9ACAR|nr:uncharacterized protein LOC114828569 [Galendromus occidentalis]